MNTEIKTIETKYNISFTSDQQKSINLIFDLLISKTKQFIGIYGFAGTGKTSMICILIKYLLETNQINNPAIVAPTNKAVMVLEDKMESDELLNVKVCTLHRLFGYRPKYNKEGKIVFSIMSLNGVKKHDVVIIDECSMIGLSIAIDIFSVIKKNPHIKFIFIGDPAQLPPVNEISSPFFTDDKISEKLFATELSIKQKSSNANNITYSLFSNFLSELEMNSYTMKHVKRSDNKYIYRFVLSVRNWVLDGKPVDHSIQSKRVCFYSKKLNDEWFTTARKYFINKKNNPKMSRNIILCWTNKAVDFYNSSMRYSITEKKTNDEYVPGDIIIFNKHHKTENRKYYTSQQVKIHSIERDYNIIDCKPFGEIKADIRIKKSLFELSKLTFEVNILTLNDGEGDIDIIDKTSTVKFNKNKQIIEEKLLKICDKLEENSSLIADIWTIYNKIFVSPYAEINLGFSMTCHKSQASTFGNVFVDFTNLSINNNDNELKKMAYTSFTRAAISIHILYE